jgi:MoaA/NifB/PqqE/SkfB family radical SAM enzyme
LKNENTLNQRNFNTTIASSTQSIYELEHIDIELTRQCNLKCIHCSIGSNSIGQELSIRKIKKILNEAQTLGLKKVGFTGGEPLLQERKFRELQNFCKKKLGVTTHLHTNGTKISPEIAEEIKRSEIDVSITFHGFNKKTHDAITQVNGSMKLSLKGLRILLSSGVNVFVYIVPIKYNFNEVIPLIKMTKEKGCE